MSRGRRGDKTYTGPNGVATDRLRELDKLRSQGSGIDGRHAPPSQEAMRAFIESQVCPWCAAGPFKMLATHTHKAHGVSAAELRELAGMTRYAPTCAPDHSAQQADRLAGRPLPRSAYERETWGGRTYSEAGKAAQQAKARAIPHVAQVNAARVGGDKVLAANAAQHSEIVRLYREGESIGGIVAAVGMSAPTVRRTLRREGIYKDGRSRRWDGDK